MTIPVTICHACGARFETPAAWLAHIGTCVPSQKTEVTKALKGLALALVIEFQEKQAAAL